jgi:hypothetical protein
MGPSLRYIPMKALEREGYGGARLLFEAVEGSKGHTE